MKGMISKKPGSTCMNRYIVKWSEPVYVTIYYKDTFERFKNFDQCSDQSQIQKTGNKAIWSSAKREWWT